MGLGLTGIPSVSFSARFALRTSSKFHHDFGLESELSGSKRFYEYNIIYECIYYIISVCYIITQYYSLISTHLLTTNHYTIYILFLADLSIPKML